jgi:hypothetical protein
MEKHDSLAFWKRVMDAEEKYNNMMINCQKFLLDFFAREEEKKENE